MAGESGYAVRKNKDSMIRTPNTKIIPDGIVPIHKTPPTWVKFVIDFPAGPSLFKSEWSNIVYVIHGAHIVIEYNPLSITQLTDTTLDKLRDAPNDKRPIIYNIHDRRKVVTGLRITPIEDAPTVRLPMPHADKSLYNKATDIHKEMITDTIQAQGELTVMMDTNPAYGCNLAVKEEQPKHSLWDKLCDNIISILKKI